MVLVVVVTAFGVPLVNGQGPKTKEASKGMPSIAEISSFTVIGIEGRTTNAREAAGRGIIPGMWQRFFGEGILQEIPGRVGANICAVYFDYASDHNGEYSFLIGAKVKNGTSPPRNMVVKRIQGGEYAVITSGKGPLPKVVPAAWQKIFALEDEGKLKRAYQTDFELYDQRAQDPQDGQIDIYLGLK